MLESISAAGDTMKPLVIHRGTAPDKPLDRWFPPSQECPHWRWGFTAKGWTNDEHAIEWLQWRDQKIRRGCFDPQKHSTGLFNTIHRVFPYDASRPVSGPPRSEQKRNEQLRGNAESGALCRRSLFSSPPLSALFALTLDMGLIQSALNFVQRRPF